MRDIKFCIGVKNEAGEVGEVILTIDELLDKGLKCEGCEILYKRQFTGLKDASGVDIYEGDIVESKPYPAMEVKFFDGAFNVTHNQHWDVKISQGYLDNTGLVAIGNIYQNPELTK